MFTSVKLFEYVWLALTVLTIVDSIENEKICKSKQCIATAETFQKHMNPNALPCHNFYEFMCGRFADTNQFQSGEGRECGFSIRKRYVDAKILELLKNNEYNHLPALQKARTFFESCLDEETVEQLGEVPIPMELNIIGLPMKPPFHLSLKRTFDCSKILAKMHRHLTFGTFIFEPTVVSNEENPLKNNFQFDHTPAINKFMSDVMPKDFEVMAIRSHAFKNEDNNLKNEHLTLLKEMMLKVVLYMNNLTNVKYSKNTKNLIEKRVTEVTDFLIKLEETRNLENRAEYGQIGRLTYLTLEELQKKTDEILEKENSEIKINWLDYLETLFENLGYDTRKIFLEGEPIIIRHMEQFQAILRLVSKTSQKVLVSACWWMVVHSLSVFATKELRKIYYDYYTRRFEKELGSRESRCLNIVRNNFGYVFGHVLIQTEENSAEVKKEVTEILVNLQDSYEETIRKSTWLDSGTKMAAINKLKTTFHMVSFQNWMKEPSEMELMYGQKIVIPGQYYSTFRWTKLVARRRNLGFLRQSNDFENCRYPMSPVTVDAWNSAYYNYVDIPIGILGPPFYGLGLQALNYGAIGALMGHELGHSLDDFGMQYDSWGQKKRWWKKKTRAKFIAKTKCYIESYEKIIATTAQEKVNGKLTLAENIADYLGFHQALKAYREYAVNHREKLLPHFEHYSHEKLFTMAFANMFCEMLTPVYAKSQIKYDEHSPGEVRIIGTLQNSVDFSQIWKCPENYAMNSNIKCNIF